MEKRNRLTRESMQFLISQLRNKIKNKTLSDFEEPRIENFKKFLKDECIRLRIYDPKEDGDFLIISKHFHLPIFMEFSVRIKKTIDNYTTGWVFDIRIEYEHPDVKEIRGHLPGIKEEDLNDITSEAEAINK